MTDGTEKKSDFNWQMRIRYYWNNRCKGPPKAPLTPPLALQQRWKRGPGRGEAGCPWGLEWSMDASREGIHSACDVSSRHHRYVSPAQGITDMGHDYD